ncbi:MAG: hypothetical protein ABR878_18190 [Roseiarcus sp.]|jgi:hypothetical protein
MLLIGDIVAAPLAPSFLKEGLIRLTHESHKNVTEATAKEKNGTLIRNS